MGCGEPRRERLARGVKGEPPLAAGRACGQHSGEHGLSLLLPRCPLTQPDLQQNHRSPVSQPGHARGTRLPLACGTNPTRSVSPLSACRQPALPTAAPQNVLSGGCEARSRGTAHERVIPVLGTTTPADAGVQQLRSPLRLRVTQQASPTHTRQARVTQRARTAEPERALLTQGGHRVFTPFSISVALLQSAASAAAAVELLPAAEISLSSSDKIPFFYLSKYSVWLF